VLRSNESFKIIILQVCSILILALAILSVGPVEISFNEILSFVFGGKLSVENEAILVSFRLSKMFTAIAAGSALAISGLIMQTYFNNFLAGPFVLGVHSGASLGVVIWLASTSFFLGESNWLVSLGLPLASLIGAVLVMVVLIFLAPVISNKSLLLVMGVLFSYFTSGIISIFISIARDSDIRSFLVWSLGSFEKISGDRLIIMSSVIMVGSVISFLFSSTLNTLFLGDRYARSVGVSIKRVRFFVVMLTSVLTGTVTAYCGPVAFIGMISPHVTRFVFKIGDHRVLLPATTLTGAILAMFAELLVSIDFGIGVTIPLNAILGIIGGPIVFAILWQNRKGFAI